MEHLFNASSSPDLNDAVIGAGAKISPSRLPLVRSGILVTRSHSHPTVSDDQATKEVEASSSCVDRFDVCLEWETHLGQYGVGAATNLPHEGGCFWFLIDIGGDLVIKVFDAGGDFADLRYSVYSRRFINVAVEMTVRDRLSGETRWFGDLPTAESEIC